MQLLGLAPRFGTGRAQDGSRPTQLAELGVALVGGPGHGGRIARKPANAALIVLRAGPAEGDGAPSEGGSGAAKPGDAIECGDSPPLAVAFWQNAVRNPVYRPARTSTTLRLDTDLLPWPRSQGKGWQSRIDAILRREMLASLKR
ncbi:MAG: BrnA antitoxin family protein [Geminicoccaceae bacterium]